MGLAASQAKLLSITSRLSDNELRSQSISAAKMALASKSSEASRKYINSLNATEYTYKTYDSDGQKVNVPLTGSQLSKYGPLKNQYALVNSSGQVLLSEQDAANFESSPDIETFLGKYGITLEPTGRTHAVTNPDYAEAFEQWQLDYNEWMLYKPNIDADIYWTSHEDNTLLSIFNQATEQCYNNAHGLDEFGGPQKAACYLHVLAHMIDLHLVSPGQNGHSHQADPNYYPDHAHIVSSVPGFFETSIVPEIITNSAICGDGWSDEMLEVSDAIAHGYNGRTLYAAPHPEQAEELTPSSDVYDKLLSNYQIDSSTGAVTLKTLLQKCKDLYCIVNWYQALYSTATPADKENLASFYTDRLLPAIESFNEDMALVLKDFNQDAYDADFDIWMENQPILTETPTIEEPIYEYSDKDMAQWYINLWHRANGPSDTKDGMETIENTVYGEVSEYGFPSTSNTTYTIRPRYDILEDGLMNSQQWLKYAIETGGVSIERVVFAEETTLDNGIKNAQWEAVIYTNVLEVSEETNAKAIAVAEAEYEQIQREIENKDKQYDSILKLLDTEHSALQAEYDSVQKIIPKNLERSLKIYS